MLVLLAAVAAEHVLRDIWLNYKEPHVLHRVQHYADHFETHLPPRGSKVRMLEIGVQSGGSARTWKQYYGDGLQYVGLDLDPRTYARSRSPSENIEVVIGSQANATFLLEVCQKHGPFDVIIDDGGHTPQLITASLRALFPSNACMAPKSVYVVEDACTMMGSWFSKQASDIYNLAGEAWWSMHARPCKQKPMRPCCLKPMLDFDGHGAQAHPIYHKYVVGIHLYESLAFFMRGKQEDGIMVKRGTDELPYNHGLVAHENKRAKGQEEKAKAAGRL